MKPQRTYWLKRKQIICKIREDASVNNWKLTLSSSHVAHCSSREKGLVECPNIFINIERICVYENNFIVTQQKKQLKNFTCTT